MMEMYISATTVKNSFLKKLKLELPYDSSSPLLSMYPKKKKEKY